MSTSNAVGRSAATHKKDRSRLCAFTFTDGRQCRTPRRSGHQHLCYYHAMKEAEALIAKQASDFAAALGSVLSAVARGYIKPKAAVSLALLGHTLNQSIKIAQDEYANAPGGNAWCERVVSLSRASCPSRTPSPSCSHAATGALRCTRIQLSITTATSSAPSTKSFRINTCTECPIITPVTTFRINTSGMVDSKTT